MTALIDLNVLLDVIQNRQPHVVASAEVLSRAVCGEFQARVASHAVTTFYYVVRNETDFTRSPVRCLSPATFLLLLDSNKKPSA